MRYQDVDLYEFCGRARGENGKGTLRCYLPDGIQTRFPHRRWPAMLIVPGGGYFFVSAREAEPIALRYLAAGFACFVLDYAVAPARYPEAFIEAGMAMRYIRAEAETLRVEPGRVAVCGFSAGGHLAGCLALLAGSDTLHSALGPGPAARPDAAVLCYPVVTSGPRAHRGSFEALCGEDEALIASLSLENCVGADAAPAFIWHTREDGSVPVQNSLLLAQAYADAGVPFSLHIFEKGPHGLSTADAAVYQLDAIPAVSEGLTRWLDMSAAWLTGRGFAPVDEA